MKMMLKKVKYSSKQGISIEWRGPDEITIDFDEMVLILITQDTHLSGDEMGHYFKPDERKAIQKYHIKLDEKKKKKSQEFLARASMKSVHRDFRHCLEWLKYSNKHDIKEVMSKLWGWKLTATQTLPPIDRMILERIESEPHHDLCGTTYLISSYMSFPGMGKPRATTRKAVEKKYGPLDWEKLRQEGIARYAEYQVVKVRNEKKYPQLRDEDE